MTSPPQGLLSVRRLIAIHTMTTDAAERRLPICTAADPSLGRPEYLAGSMEAHPHLAAATDRIMFTLHNVASTADHILATHSAFRLRRLAGNRIYF